MRIIVSGSPNIKQILIKYDCMLPVGLDVVGSTEKLDLPGAGRQSLYHAVDLIRFVTGGADLEESV